MKHTFFPISENLNALPTVGGALIIDNTNFEYITTCPRSAQLRLIEGRERASGTAALNAGSTVHEAMATRLLSGKGGASEPEMLKASMEWLASNPQPADDWRTPDLILELLQKYNQHYAIENFSVLEIDGKKLVEMPFAIPLGEITLDEPIRISDRVAHVSTECVEKEVYKLPVIWSGKIDALVKREGMLWVLDHKTTSILGDTYFDDFVMSNQMQGYVWAASKMFHDLKFAGVIINVLAIRKPAKIVSKATMFDRRSFFYDTKIIERWEFNTMNIISDFVAHISRKYFPTHTKWCVGKYGKCSYFDVCSLPDDQQHILLGSDLYKNVTWSPLNKTVTPNPAETNPVNII